ncbi:MAG: DUF4339 domain-containing protein, partial [Verrucomicrobiaceae bacterium]
MVSPSAPAEVYYVLKKGDILGPFSREDLRNAQTKGELLDRDFVQLEGQPIWQPLIRVLDKTEEDRYGALAPDWRSISRWAWIRFRNDIAEKSLVTGGICLAVGAVVMVLSFWPVLLWLPWFAAAVFAAIALLRRQRAEQALMLLAGVICLPFFFLILGPGRSTAPEPTLSAQNNI